MMSFNDYLEFSYRLEWNKYAIESERHKIRYVIKRWCDIPIDRVLDMGSGNGHKTIMFKDHAKSVCAADVDPLYSSHFQEIGIRFYHVDLNCDSLPLPSGYFDLVFSDSSIEHLHNPRHMMKEAYRLLKKRGRLICIGPDLRRVKFNFWDAPTHVSPMTVQRMRHMGEEAGFSTVYIGHFGLPIGIGLGITKLYRLMPFLFCLGNDIIYVGEKT